MLERSKSASAYISVPCLEYFPEIGAPPRRILLDPIPFRIGRSMAANYVIYSAQVSKEHTEIYCTRDEYRIRDLGSTNGTFVNGTRITDGPLDSGDIVHVAHNEFRFIDAAPRGKQESNLFYTEVWSPNEHPESAIKGHEHLREMLTQSWLRVIFQPIVSMKTGQTIGYEALGRGTHRALTPLPSELFKLASQCNLSVELSQAFRRLALAESVHLSGGPRLFFNLHPAEVSPQVLPDTLKKLRIARASHQKVVLEVHEGLVADIETVRRLRAQLIDLDIELAYDDFGAGQSRLTELAEVPPHFLKLDRVLVNDIDRTENRQKLVHSLCRFALDLGVQVIAEGIERPEEAQFFQDLGCQLGQGFLYGRPQPMTLVSYRTDAHVF